MKKQDEIEELFSSTFANFESMPPLDVKAAIDDQLFNGKTPVTGRRKGFIWISSSIILIGIVSFFALKNGRNNNPVLAKNEISVQESSPASPTSESIKNESHKELSQLKIQLSKKKRITQFEEQKLTQNNELKANNSAKKSSKIENNSKLEGNNISLKKQKGTRVKTSQTNKKTADLVKNKTVSFQSKDSKTESSNSFSQIEKKENPIVKSEIPTNFIFSNEVVDAKNESIEKSKSPEENTLDENENSVAENVEVQDTTTQIQWSEETAIPRSLIGFDASMIRGLSPWCLSLYSGGTFGSSILKNSTSENYKMKEQIGFSISIEANYRLNSKLGISAGIDINSRKDIFYKVVPAGDSIIDGVTTQYIYFNPVTQDSIIDTIISPNYVVLQSEYNQNQRIQHNSFAIPIYLSLHLFSKGNWRMNLNSGLRLSYVQNKMVYNPDGMIEPDFKRFGLRVNLRPEITYSLKKFGIGCYLNLGYDAIPAIQWTDIKRNRIDYGFGLVLKYHL
jgi:hypothetical protein